VLVYPSGVDVPTSTLRCLSACLRTRRRAAGTQRPDAPYADRGYDHDNYRKQVCEAGIKPVIARRGEQLDSRLGVYRWVVEQDFALLHWFRRLRIGGKSRRHPPSLPPLRPRRRLLATPPQHLKLLGVLRPVGSGMWYPASAGSWSSGERGRDHLAEACQLAGGRYLGAGAHLPRLVGAVVRGSVRCTVPGMIMIAHYTMRPLYTRTWDAFARLLDKHHGAGSAPTAGAPGFIRAPRRAAAAKEGGRARGAWSERARRTWPWYPTAISRWPRASSEPSPAELADSSPRSIRSCRPGRHGSGGRLP
jgi:hypothetical protein